MGILGSMITGVTGLAAQGNALDIIGDNISNISTNGFKASRGEFADMVSRNLKGIEGGNQIGRGTQLRSVTPVFIQGSMIRTERATDLAINGDGFFIARAVDGGQSFTRDGSLRFDKDGFLVNMDGRRIQGYVARPDGKMSPELGNLSIPTNAIPAQGTKKVSISANLDSRENVGVPFDPLKPQDTSMFSTGLTVYDTKGSAHICTVYFNKTAENIYQWHAMVDGEEAVGGVKGTPVEMGTGTITFDKDGKLIREETTKSQFSFNNGADPNQSIEFDFGDAVETEMGTGVAGSTQYGTEAVLYKFHQDGYKAGVLSSLSIDETGTIAGLYSNGITMDLAQIAIAKFENNEGLTKMGGNDFRESKLSGQAYIGKPGQNGRGTVLAKALEQSITDLAGEFVNLIQAQRGFQANSKIITTSDELLGDVINLKR
jgi:flagellar hook protein FlgE